MTSVIPFDRVVFPHAIHEGDALNIWEMLKLFCTNCNVVPVVLQFSEVGDGASVYCTKPGNSNRGNSIN